jgi:GrpB-like predicted nucleotidyltransferase (UPF0157 family)
MGRNDERKNTMQPLQILPYDPQWIVDFGAERQRIAQSLGAVAQRIEHHGSTAVPGLDAKPIIDIQISVAHLRPMGACAVPLATLGYVLLPHVMLIGEPQPTLL